MEILICVVSGFFWALFDLTRKLSLKFFSPKLILIFFMLTQTIIFFVWTLYSDFFLEIKYYFLPGLILIFIGLVSAILFLKAIANSELSLTIPLLSFTPLFSAILSFFLLDEQLTIIQYLAIFLIILGTLILYSSDLRVSSIFYSIEKLKNNVSAKLMLIVALSWSITPILDKISLQYSSIPVHGFFQSFGMLLLLLFISVTEMKKFKIYDEKKKKLILLTVLIGTVATIFQFYAILNNYVPIMESIKRTIGQYGSLFFGYLIFKEEINIQKIFGILLLSLGIFFMI